MPSPGNKYFADSIFWIEVEKINPNPFQPRREFDQVKLNDLAESIRMYGVLQPLVVTRREMPKDDGGLVVEYELISGERRLRAAKIAGVVRVPTLVRTAEDSDRIKLELAIIENLQREDINAVDRARAFDRLIKEFGMKHFQVAEKIGKSREYVSNTLRILALPAEMLDAVSAGKMSEGHTRPLLMLVDRPEEQVVLFKEITTNKVSVREAELFARRIAQDRARKKDKNDPELAELETMLAGSLGTKVYIEKRPNGGKITIDFFSNADVRTILELLNKGKGVSEIPAAVADPLTADSAPIDDRSVEEKNKDDNSGDLYSLKDFSL
jgi:ParB family chromosome partitioning protein